MATRDLLKFLQKVEKDLAQSSQAYRENIANYRVHTFFLTKASLYAEVLNQINEDGVRVAKRELTTLVSDFFDDLKREFMGLQESKNLRIFDKQSTGDSFSITMQSKFKGSTTSFNRDISQTFEAIKFIYAGPLETFKRKVRPLYRKSNQELKEGQFLDLGHANDSSVIESRVSDLLQYGELPKGLGDIPEISALFSFVKLDKKDVMYVTFESASGNRALGRSVQAEIKKEVEQKLKEAIEKLNLLEQDGSDSAVTRKRKQTIKVLTDPFKQAAKKNKNIIVTTEDTKINYSGTSPVKYEKKGKGTRNKSRGKRVSKSVYTGKQFKVKQSTYSLGTILALINRQLPDTVAKNMRSPRLENRSGRFAGSVKALNVLTTRQGFPSIEYTYQKEPYQVFESTSGSRFSSVERDPRALIDLSIREIAAQLALGRIYTRRV